MMKSQVAEKYVRLVQGMNVGVGLHQGSSLSPLLFAVVMNRLTDGVKHESLQTVMFADDKTEYVCE